MPDPEISDKPADASVYVSSNPDKVEALRLALWLAGYKVMTRAAKRTDPDQDVTVLLHNATETEFQTIRASINF